jgi:hypothetical protein
LLRGLEVSSLTEYISNLLRQGYSEEQIRKYLAQNKYPASMIDGAFQALQGGMQGETPTRPPDQVTQLTTYLQTYRAQGYQVEQLRPYLLQQGYKEKDVDQAITLVTGEQRIKHEVHFPAATVAKIAFLLIFGIAIYFAFSFFTGSDTTPVTPITSDTRMMDVQMQLEKGNYRAGEKIIPQLEIQNKGTTTKYDVRLTYQLLDKRNRVIDEEGETRSLRESLQLSPQYTIPDLEVGSYTFKVTAIATGADPAVALTSITIIEEEQEPEEPIVDAPPTIIILEPGDDEKDVMSEAMQAAERGDENTAAGLCLGINTIVKRDECLSTIAATGQEANHCEPIANPDTRDSCYMAFIMNGDYSYCDQITNPLYQDTCDKLEHIRSLPPYDDEPIPSINDYTN